MLSHLIPNKPREDTETLRDKETCPRSHCWWQSCTGLVCDQALCHGHLSSASVDAADPCSPKRLLPLPTLSPGEETSLPYGGSSSVAKNIRRAVSWGRNSPLNPLEIHSKNIALLKPRHSNFDCFCIYFLFIERVQNPLHISDTKTESTQCPLQPRNSEAPRPQKPWLQQILTLPSLLEWR